jgi:hypothetical protein
MGKTAGLLFCLVVFTAGCAATPAEPREFRSESGGFSILVPAAMEENTQDVVNADGKLVLHGFVGGSETKRYIVGYVDYPEEAVTTLGADALLARSRADLIGSEGASVLSEKKTSLDGHPGLEISFDTGVDTNPQLTIKARIYLAGSRLYQVMVVVPKSDVNTEDINNFLESFRLLPR